MGGLAGVGGHSLLGEGTERVGFPPHAGRRPAHDDARSHVVCGFTPGWRSRVVDAWRAETDGEVIGTLAAVAALLAS